MAAKFIAKVRQGLSFYKNGDERISEFLGDSEGPEAAVWFDAERSGDRVLAFCKAVGVGRQYGYMEYQGYEASGKEQGTVLCRPLRIITEGSEVWMRAEHIAASDGYYEHWAQQKGAVDEMIYHLCSCKATRCHMNYNKDRSLNAVHIAQWRMLTLRDLLNIKWAGAAALQEAERALVQYGLDHAEELGQSDPDETEKEAKSRGAGKAHAGRDTPPRETRGQGGSSSSDPLRQASMVAERLTREQESGGGLDFGDAYTHGG